MHFSTGGSYGRRVLAIVRLVAVTGAAAWHPRRDDGPVLHAKTISAAALLLRC
jgi:hypothetical protein